MSSLWFSSPLCRITPTAAASPKTGRGASPSPGPAAPTAPTSSCPSWCSPAWQGSSPARPTRRPSCSSSGGDTGVARGWVKPLGAPLGARRNWGNRGAGRKGLWGTGGLNHPHAEPRAQFLLLFLWGFSTGGFPAPLLWPCTWQSLWSCSPPAPSPHPRLIPQ